MVARKAVNSMPFSLRFRPAALVDRAQSASISVASKAPNCCGLARRTEAPCGSRKYAATFTLTGAAEEVTAAYGAGVLHPAALAPDSVEVMIDGLTAGFLEGVDGPQDFAVRRACTGTLVVEASTSLRA